MDPALPGSTAIQFESNHTHSASLGATATFFFTEEFSLEVEGAGVLGTSMEFPIELGGAKLSLGARGGVGLGFQLGGGAGLAARWQITHRNAPFDLATVKHTENSFSLGMTFAL